MGEAGGPERVGVLGEGGESGEASKEAGGEQGVNPGWRGSASEVTEETANEQATEKVAGEYPDGELVEGGFLGEALNTGRKAKTSQGAKAAT